MALHHWHDYPEIPRSLFTSSRMEKIVHALLDRSDLIDHADTHIVVLQIDPRDVLKVKITMDSYHQE